MSNFLKIAAYLFHPLWVPTFGVMLYFWITPRYITADVIWVRVLIVFTLTCMIPLLAFLMLRSMGYIKSLEAEEVKERRIPLLIQVFVFFAVVKIVFENYTFPELYYFFIAGIYSALTALLLVIFKVKASLHMMGVAALSMFLIALSIHFKINLLGLIALSFFAIGWVGSSRLYTEAHTPSELIMGFVIGFLPQLIMVNYWL
jgi:membrane-associated phospholipid phosphatase